MKISHFGNTLFNLVAPALVTLVLIKISNLRFCNLATSLRLALVILVPPKLRPPRFCNLATYLRPASVI